MKKSVIFFIICFQFLNKIYIKIKIDEKLTFKYLEVCMKYLLYVQNNNMDKYLIHTF